MIIGSLGTPLKALDSLYTPHLINCFHQDFHFLKVYLIVVMNIYYMKVEQKVGRKTRGIRRKSGFEGFLNFLLIQISMQKSQRAGKKLIVVVGGKTEPHSLGIGFFCIKLTSHSQHIYHNINKVFDQNVFVFLSSTPSASFIIIIIIKYIQCNFFFPSLLQLQGGG